MRSREQLWRYPVRIAQLVLGESDPERVAASISEFAMTYEDTADQVDYIRPIIDVIWAGGRLPSGATRETFDDGSCGGNDPSSPPTAQAGFEDRLGGLAFEALGASVNWYVEHGVIAEQAVVLWVARVCGVTHEPDGGFTCSIEGLSDFALTRPSDAEDLVVLQEMCESVLPLLTYLGLAPEVLWLFAAVQASRGIAGPPDLFSRISAEAGGEQVVKRLSESWWQWLSNSWWDIEHKMLQESGNDICALVHFKYREPIPEEVLRRHEKALALFGAILNSIPKPGSEG
ncbi:MAG: hypothetical protein JW889_13785 [Verrucomicrobia bacterium]|nr:hypothetical protein [Verrucomicrobiota bacterium]